MKSLRLLKTLGRFECYKHFGKGHHNSVYVAKPIPPQIPKLEDCCGNGCSNCVLDSYYVQREIYEKNYTKYKKMLKFARNQ
jgi:hypothetical protein